MSISNPGAYNPWTSPNLSPGRTGQLNDSVVRREAEKQVVDKPSAAGLLNGTISDARGPLVADMHVHVSITGPAGVGKTYLANRINALIEEMRDAVPGRAIRSSINQTQSLSRSRDIGDKVVRHFNPPMLDSLIDGAINEGLKAGEQRTYMYGVDVAAPPADPTQRTVVDHPTLPPAISAYEANLIANWLLRPVDPTTAGNMRAVAEDARETAAAALARLLQGLAR